MASLPLSPFKTFPLEIPIDVLGVSNCLEHKLRFGFAANCSFYSPGIRGDLCCGVEAVSPHLYPLFWADTSNLQILEESSPSFSQLQLGSGFLVCIGIS